MINYKFQEKIPQRNKD